MMKFGAALTIKLTQAVVKYKILIFQGTKLTLDDLVCVLEFWMCLQIGTTLDSSSK